MNIQLKRTDSNDSDFQSLVTLLDAELRVLDGDDHEFYAKLNKTDLIRHVVVAYVDDKPAGCGAIRAFSEEATEVKRVYVRPDARRLGIAFGVLNELEKWATELGYASTVLETGKRQPEAIALYLKSGYRITDNYGKYVGVENSVCFRKQLR